MNGPVEKCEKCGREVENRFDVECWCGHLAPFGKRERDNMTTIIIIAIVAYLIGAGVLF